MIVAIVIVSVVLFVLFLVAAVAGNRAQTRMVQAERKRTDAVGPADPGTSELP